jgi:hypothetical protein
VGCHCQESKGVSMHRNVKRKRKKDDEKRVIKGGRGI